jgi:hypothetical protein
VAPKILASSSKEGVNNLLLVFLTQIMLEMWKIEDQPLGLSFALETTLSHGSPKSNQLLLSQVQKVEYQALSKASQESLWLSTLMNDLGARNDILCSLSVTMKAQFDW